MILICLILLFICFIFDLDLILYWIHFGSNLDNLRHSCASLLIYKDANINAVAKYLGHTKIEETLKTYSHLFISTLDEIINVIDTLEDNKTDD